MATVMKKKKKQQKNLANRRNEKKEKQRFEDMSTLWIAPGCKLRWHQPCGFCGESTGKVSVVHCPSCVPTADGDGEGDEGEWFCEECDWKVHQPKKRAVLLR